jgi:outer membrane protein assembly factor BamB
MAAADGMVYANTWTSGTEGNVYAFRAHCATGGTTCTPLWTAPDDGYGHLAAGDGYLFATSVFGDALDAFPAACGKGGATCQAAWTARSLGGPRWAPVVSNGVVYVGSADGSVRGFPVRCGTGGATCQPSWTRRVTGSEMSPPAVEGTHLFTVTTDGRLSAFRLPPERAPSSPGPGTLVLYAGLAALVVILLVVRSRRRAH